MGSFSLALRAPAGYGKSTLVSHWLETREGSSAWLSLDETDGDIRTFLGYVAAAAQTVFPDACAETLVQLEALSGILNSLYEMHLPVLSAECLNSED
jgi:ATP/maltotriose-dependent transcriptional regulator MalT